jgi:hypothetical protein
MPHLAEHLLALTRQPAQRDLHGLLPLINNVVDAIGNADRAFLLSVRGSTETFLAIDEDVLPSALFWSPVEDGQHTFLLDDEQRWQLAGDAISVALTLTTISPLIANDTRQSIDEGTLIERLSDGISGNFPVSPGLTFLWADSLIQAPNHIIALLALEDDVYAIIAGVNLAGESIVAVVGQQPFEAMLHKGQAPKNDAAGSYLETLEADGALLEGQAMPDQRWWERLNKRGEGTLLRASWLQLAMQEPLAIAKPYNNPLWRLPLLPLAKTATGDDE